jgi:phosphonate metabolism protein (transferase hexapeptide repeat family)
MEEQVAPEIHEGVEVRDSVLGRYCEVGARTALIESVLGDYSYIMNDGEVIYTELDRFVSVAAHVRLNPGQHPMQRASQHHFQYRSARYGLGGDDDAFFAERRRHRLRVGADVWIGHGAVVMGGLTVGVGAVIGAGAVVTKDVPDYAVVAGVPARFIRPRFSTAVCEALKRIAWWEWSHAALARAMVDFRDLDAAAFCRKYDPAP